MYDEPFADFARPIGRPLVRAMGPGHWEARGNLPRGRIARVLFCTDEENMIRLLGFIKKSQKTPQGDIALAMARMKGATA
jgi:phage-related protein